MMYYEAEFERYLKQYAHSKTLRKRRAKGLCTRYISSRSLIKLSLVSFTIILTTNLYLSDNLPDLKLPSFPQSFAVKPDPLKFENYLKVFSLYMKKIPMDQSIQKFILADNVEKALKGYHASGQYYRKFSLSAPNFPSTAKAFSELFLKNPANRAEMSSRLGPPMRGVVAAIPYGIFATSHDCNDESSLTQYLFSPPGVKVALLDTYVFPLNDLETPCELGNFMMRLLPRLAQAKGFLSLKPMTLVVHGECDQYTTNILRSIGLTDIHHFHSDDNTAAIAYQSKFQINSCISPIIHRALVKPAKELLNINFSAVRRTSQVAMLLRLMPLTYRRSVVNLDDVEQILNDRFPEVVIFHGSTKLVETQRIFQESNILIAVHGPVLYNIIYAQPNSQVVEIFATRPDGSYITDYGEDKVNDIWRLCQVLGHQYYRMMEEPTGYLGAVIVNPQNFELMVDTLLADDGS